MPVPRERYHILAPVDDLTDRKLIDFASLVARVEDADVTVLVTITDSAGKSAHVEYKQAFHVNGS